MTESYKTLQFHYKNRRFSALEKHKNGVPVIGYTSNTVPIELIEAAGFYPTLVDADCSDFSASDQFMEPVFDHRTKSIFNEMLAGKWSFLRALIIPRTSEAEHKLFLYLMEVKRLTQNPNIPEIYFFDLLHTQHTLSEEYSFEQIKLLDNYLSNLGKTEATTFKNYIKLSNQIKTQLNQLAEYRYQGLLTGVEAMTIIGAMYCMERSEYLMNLEEVLKRISTRKPLKKFKKVLVKGYGINHTNFHESIEKDGSIVVAEDDWWGSRAGGSLIEISESPLKSLFYKYFYDTPSPRVFPMEKSHEWFRNELKKGIDKVAYYLPADEDTLGWEIPTLESEFLYS
ncbi:MAG: 2-hydroxyacyl-CoA dehydratase family protein [Spirosomataceae bacterium]